MGIMVLCQAIEALERYISLWWGCDCGGYSGCGDCWFQVWCRLWWLQWLWWPMWCWVWCLPGGLMSNCVVVVKWGTGGRRGDTEKEKGELVIPSEAEEKFGPDLEMFILKQSFVFTVVLYLYAICFVERRLWQRYKVLRVLSCWCAVTGFDSELRGHKVIYETIYELTHRGSSPIAPINPTFQPAHCTIQTWQCTQFTVYKLDSVKLLQYAKFLQCINLSLYNFDSVQTWHYTFGTAPT